MIDSIKEILDRARRIETKLTRLLMGEGDQGAKIEHVMVFDMAEDIWALKFKTRSVTLSQVVDIMEEAGVRSMEVVDVYENGNLLFRVENFDAHR
jgi:hypothetical protein